MERYEACMACGKTVTVKQKGEAISERDMAWPFEFQEFEKLYAWKNSSLYLMAHVHGHARDRKTGLIQSVILCNQCLKLTDKEMEELRAYTESVLSPLGKKCNRNYSLSAVRDVFPQHYERVVGYLSTWGLEPVHISRGPMAYELREQRAHEVASSMEGQVYFVRSEPRR